MSMLAEQRSRQKWSHDPRNTNWARDKTKFGYQMLTKMGWSEGKGLGQNLTGNTRHIRVNKLGSNAGIGLKKSHDDDWISHQDDFNALLSSLNQGSGESATGKISSLESQVKSSKKKILYKRFIKSKDLSNASSHDLACIFGQRSVSAPVTPHDSDNECKLDSSETSCPVIGDASDDLSINTVNSQLSIADYFASKMAALKQKKINASANTINSDTISNLNGTEDECCMVEEEGEKSDGDDAITGSAEVEVRCKSKKRKNETDDFVLENGLVKKKKKRTENLQANHDIDVDENSCENTEIVKKKKKKRTENLQTNPDIDVIENSCKNTEIEKKKKKRTENLQTNLDIDVVENSCENTEIIKKKKKKRTENLQTNPDIDLENSCENTEIVKKKKKKRTENIETNFDIDVVDNCCENTEIIKKKKKKRTENIETNSDVTVVETTGEEIEVEVTKKKKKSENLCNDVEVMTKKKKKKKKNRSNIDNDNNGLS